LADAEERKSEEGNNVPYLNKVSNSGRLGDTRQTVVSPIDDPLSMVKGMEEPSPLSKS
jgi:hypothetical protein